MQAISPRFNTWLIVKAPQWFVSIFISFQDLGVKFCVWGYTAFGLGLVLDETKMSRKKSKALVCVHINVYNIPW